MENCIEEELIEVDFSPSAVREADRRLLGQESRLISFKTGPYIVITRADLITASLAKMRFSKVDVLVGSSGTEIAMLMYDIRVYDKPIDEVAMQVSKRVWANPMNVALTQRVLEANAKIVAAFSELDSFVQDPEKHGEGSFRAFESISRIPTNIEGFYYVEILLKSR